MYNSYGDIFMERKKVLIIGLIMILFIVISIIFINFPNIRLELIGEDITLNVYDEYKELGAKAYYKDKDISDNIYIDNSNLDTSKVGVYKIEYIVQYRQSKKKVERTVKVIDKVPPVLTLNGDSIVKLTVGDEFNDPLVIANDNYDGDLTSKVEIISNVDKNTVGTYQIIYKVSDSSNNESSTSRTVVYREKVNVTKSPEIAVLNYHFFYDPTLGESCNESICIDVKKFREQLDYLKDNNYKTLTMEEFREWMYGEINIPEKSVLITIDDGAMGTGAHNGNKLIPILEEYKMHATLFLITGWWDISNYSSEYLSVESHTNDMHMSGLCGGVASGAQMLCSSQEEVLADLKKSIEITGSKTAFCFPFYAYNNKAIENVKEVGFSLAFIGGNRKANRLVDKYKIPRYPIYKNTSLQEFINIVSN